MLKTENNPETEPCLLRQRLRMSFRFVDNII